LPSTSAQKKGKSTPSLCPVRAKTPPRRKFIRKLDFRGKEKEGYAAGCRVLLRPAHEGEMPASFKEKRERVRALLYRDKIKKGGR